MLIILNEIEFEDNVKRCLWYKKFVAMISDNTNLPSDFCQAIVNYQRL